MMEVKDWIVLLVPILCNGIILYCFQKIIGRKIDRQEKRQGIRDEVVKMFWNKLQRLNDTFVQTNIAAMRDPRIAENSIEIFYGVVLDIIQYYDTNEYDLKIFSKEFDELKDSWREFERTYKIYIRKRLDDRMKMELGEKLQIVKERNQKLIKIVREKY